MFKYLIFHTEKAILYSCLKIVAMFVQSIAEKYKPNLFL